MRKTMHGMSGAVIGLSIYIRRMPCLSMLHHIELPSHLFTFSFSFSLLPCFPLCFVCSVHPGLFHSLLLSKRSLSFPITQYGHIQQRTSVQVPGTPYPCLRQVSKVGRCMGKRFLTVQTDHATTTGTPTINQLSQYIAGSCMGVACLVSFVLVFLHATHLSRPSEQIKYDWDYSIQTGKHLTICQNNPHYCAHPNLCHPIIRQHLPGNVSRLPHTMDESVRSPGSAQLLLPCFRFLTLEFGWI